MNASLITASSLGFIFSAALVGQLAAEVQVASRAGPAPAAGDGALWSAQPIGGGPGGGADIITGDIVGLANHGAVGPIAAYSVGTAKCNTGDTILSTVFTTNQHHIGAGNIFRLKTVDGSTRMEQIGQSWVFHSFCDLQQGLCGSCTPPPGGGCAPALGIGCSSPNTAARMGTQGNLGPRYDVNASTGFFTFPNPDITETAGIGTLGKRIQVASSDLDPALNPGAQYFAEGLTLHPQDAGAGNSVDNATHRPLVVAGPSGTPPDLFFFLSPVGAAVQQQPALFAWEEMDATVQIFPVDVPSDGQYFIGFDATDLGDGQWHYEYAIYNISSHRSGQSFSVPIPEGVAVTNIGFKDVDYHTQEILAPEFRVDNVDWSATVANGALTWATSEYSGPAPAGNEHTANALRWGTLYNFRFDADASPTTVSATLALFRPGTPDSVSIELLGPGSPCLGDLSGDGLVTGIDLALLLGMWGKCGAPESCPADLDGSGSVNGIDLATLLAAWGPCR